MSRRKPREKSALMSMGAFSLIKKGVSRYDLADPYALAVGLTWPRFLGCLFGLYLTVNAVFANVYMVVPGSVANARPWAFSDHFFFSLETLATVGYGEMYPGSVYGHLISSLEITTGLAFTSLLTGLTFVRFSRPRSKFVFAEHPLVTTHNSKPTLMLRIGNGRAIVLAEAQARMSVLITEKSHEGIEFRRTYELKLVRQSLPVFPLSWTLMHEIDETSPLHGLDEASYAYDAVRLFVSFEARDPDLATVVHDLRVYGPKDVLFGVRYVDIIVTDEAGEPMADLTRISETEPDQSTAP